MIDPLDQTPRLQPPRSLPRLRYLDALRLVFASQAERRFAIGGSADDKRRARNARKAARS